MNLKLKSLVAAVAMVAAGAANAAILTDSFNGGAGLTTGTGDGELFLSIFDPSVNQSLVLDLNLTVNQFRFNNASLINTFSVTDPTLQGFIAASPNQTLMRWNLGGLSNMGFGPDLGLVTTHGNAGATIDPDESTFDGNALTSGMGFIEAYANVNPGTAVVGSTTPAGHMGGFWAGTVGGALRFNNEHIGFGGGELMSFIFADENDTLGNPTLVQAFANAEWMVDPVLGKVSYAGEMTSPVPVPAAVWLFASGLLGLVGIARRRKQA
jgi:hypothetical protein